jgi:hypothetical protein
MSLVALISCKEETSYRMEILLKNETDSKQIVQLFPKAAYLKAGRDDLYMYSELGNGDYKSNYFDILPGESNVICITEDLNQRPSALALKVFDSIYIIQADSTAIARFYPDSVLGYSENLFYENSTWVYEVKNYKERTNFTQNPTEAHQYSFIISTDKYQE